MNRGAHGHREGGRPFEGVSTIIPTIFTDHGCGAVDHAAIVRVAEHARRQGACAVVVGGLASEPWALSPPESHEILRTVVETVYPEIPVAVGIDQHPRAAMIAARQAADAGASHLMVRIPTGMSAIPAVSAYLASLYDASGLPVILQDVPQIAGVGVSTADLRALVGCTSALQGLKLEGQNSGPIVSAVAGLPLPTIVGWGGLHLIDRLERGAAGCMPGAALTPAFVTIVKEWQAGRRAEAEASYNRLLPLLLYASQSLDLMVATNKLALRKLGLVDVDSCCPLQAAPDPRHVATVGRLVDELLQSGVLGHPPD